MTRRIFLNAVALAAYLTLLVSGIGCAREHAEDRAIVDQALATIQYRPNSRIRFVMPRLDPGTIIKVWAGEPAKAKSAKPFVVSKSGYLVFIQEHPECDNMGAGNYYFVPLARPTYPVLLGRGCDTAEVRDKSGRLIQQTYVVLAWGKAP